MLAGDIMVSHSIDEEQVASSLTWTANLLE